MLAEKECFYCGEPPKYGYHNKHSRSGKYDPWVRNGIDRVDSSIGYRSDNVVTSCTQCNRMKNAYSQRDFLDKIMKIAGRHGR